MMRIIMIIVIGLVMAMVMFGRNPIKEMQKKEVERRQKYGIDPLTQETNMYIEKKKTEGGRTGSAGSDTKVATPDAELQDAGDEILVKPTQEGIVISAGSVGAGSAETTTKLPTPPEKTNDYYPPMVGADVNVATKTNKIENMDKLQKLRSGQTIVSEGMVVYVVDKSGVRTPLPDGVYALYGGGSMEIRSGVRVLMTPP